MKNESLLLYDTIVLVLALCVPGTWSVCVCVVCGVRVVHT